MADTGEREEEPPVAPRKKAKPLPPLEDYMNTSIELIMALRALQSAWNVLDRDGEFMEYLSEYGQERQEYLSDMHEIIRSGGSCSYQNPFGADDREEFANSFGKLFPSEQQAFLELARRCQRENRLLTDQDLNDLLSKPPTEPYCIQIQEKEGQGGPNKKDSDNGGNGTERRPFPSLEAAVEQFQARGELPIRVVSCPCKTKRQCGYRGCRVLLCEHGDGLGTWIQENRDVWWDFTPCMHCEKVRCSRHCFPECDVCRNANAASGSLGCGSESLGPFAVCQNCAIVCQKIVEGEHADDDKVGTTVCGFRCCQKCIANHRCGDDPTEYC